MLQSNASWRSHFISDSDFIFRRNASFFVKRTLWVLLRYKRIEFELNNLWLTNLITGYIIKIEKGKTSNGYAKTLKLFRKITLMLCKGWRYFFMEITKSKRIIINNMYSLSIAIPPFFY